jgi:translation initiation factor IF-3
VLRFRDVRVIGPEGEQIGILQSRQALNMAKEQGLDLVMVSPSANPPVCKIIDYGRHKYLTEKQQKENKRKQQDVKGIKISPRIAEHDIQFQLKKAISFLEEGHKVKITCQFKAREVTHPELGRQKLDKMAEQVKDIAVVERTPTLEGRLMIMVLVPKPEIKQKKKDAKAEDKQNGGEAVQDNGNGEDNPTEGV